MRNRNNEAWVVINPGARVASYTRGQAQSELVMSRFKPARAYVSGTFSVTALWVTVSVTGLRVTVSVWTAALWVIICVPGLSVAVSVTAP